MSFYIIIIGLLLIISAIKNRQDELFDLVKDDFAGNGDFSNSFIGWLVAIVFIVLIGKVNIAGRSFEPISNAFLFLVFVVIFLGNRDIVTKFIDEIKKGTL